MSIKIELSRFILLGAINTVLTLCLYNALIFIMSAKVAYTITYILGLFFVFVFYPSKIFKVDGVWAKLISVFVYISSLMLGVYIVSMIDNERVAVIFAVVVTTLYNYFIMRFFFRRFF